MNEMNLQGCFPTCVLHACSTRVTELLMAGILRGRQIPGILSQNKFIWIEY